MRLNFSKLKVDILNTEAEQQVSPITPQVVLPDTTCTPLSSKPFKSEKQVILDTPSNWLPQRFSFGGVIIPQEGWSVSGLSPSNLSLEVN